MANEFYTTGTVSVANGGTVVTGAATGWTINLVTGGLFNAAGYSVPIASVDSDTQITLAYGWPGAALAGAAYHILLTPSAAAGHDHREPPVARDRHAAEPGIRPAMGVRWGHGGCQSGDGNLRANNADLTAATELYASKTGADGSDLAAFLAALGVSGSAVKGNLVLSSPSQNTQTAFEVTAVTDATGYVKIAVQAGAGAASFSAGARIGVLFARTGDPLADAIFNTLAINGATADTTTRLALKAAGLSVRSRGQRAHAQDQQECGRRCRVDASAGRRLQPCRSRPDRR